MEIEAIYLLHDCPHLVHEQGDGSRSFQTLITLFMTVSLAVVIFIFDELRSQSCSILD
jgi:hypothetical protein